MAKPTLFSATTRNKYIFWIFIVLFVAICLYYYTETYDDNPTQYTLSKDGFCVLYDPQYNSTDGIPRGRLHDDVLSVLPPGYTFIDYIYKINDGALSTFHRDVTSSQNIYRTTHPVYTLILYKYDGELLSVCPHSNQTYPFVWSRILNISGKAGTAFLFDSELLHAGRANKCRKRRVIQYKLCHTDDLGKLAHLHGVRAEKMDVCKLSPYNDMVRKLSYYFEMPINCVLYPFMIRRENTNTLIGKLQSFIPMQYYNNL
jgi:hypothetical protein